jgi:hypothetical protein
MQETGHIDTLNEKWWPKCEEEQDSTSINFGAIGGIFIVMGFAFFVALGIQTVESIIKRFQAIQRDKDEEIIANHRRNLS